MQINQRKTLKKYFSLSALFMVVVLQPKSVEAQSIYDFKVMTLDSSEIDFSKFKGKKILVVNTASKCSFTPQYKQLQAMYEKHSDELVVVAFPANDFLWQEPGSNKRILEFCKNNYGVTFPMASKISVKGRKIHPLFKWLIQIPNPDFEGNIKWNFEKFLFDENGKLLRRFRSKTTPEVIENIIFG